ncbi:SDR family oxidoreductase [Vibrio tapetis]|uniref:Putative oxidoreductase with NAD(P)-binding Rossmann-fold domain n=1 Tax=Vibrio tapetis subsp. tapetis TaxID=1671868 RepID=A0A2N8ZBL9_9VIBR|nr:SDR family oxidoreductase [Vibrio tapetis]SON49287.1 putative oxidoreductase with NAD(P)-binding Rossmann-fold domain [Vibrio tapetis subsp. tapetis]
MTKSILITGCSSGIGYTCAHALHAKGYHVIASCRRQSDVEKLQGQGLKCIQLNMDSVNSIDQAVAEVLLLTNGKLDVLFNNAAYGQAGALEDLPTQALRDQFETNFFGWHHLVKGILPSMRNHNSGRIIQNSSVLGFAAMRYRGAYNASKFALEGWTDTLRLELMDTNIHISLIQPGPIETQFRANALAKFRQWINIETSAHRQQYLIQVERLASKASGNDFTLPSEAIVAPLLHAIESDNPKIRYPITTPTKVFAILKRILPTRLLDQLLLKAG